MLKKKRSKKYISQVKMFSNNFSKKIYILKACQGDQKEKKVLRKQFDLFPKRT